jgi:hypothetical protein
MLDPPLTGIRQMESRSSPTCDVFGFLTTTCLLLQSDLTAAGSWPRIVPLCRLENDE